MLHKLVFDVTDADTRLASANVGAWVRAGDDGTMITHTTVGAKEALDVYIANGVNVEVDIDGIYDAGTNADPDNVGAIFHTRAATPGDSNQTFRSTGAKPNADSLDKETIWALDTNSFLHGWNGATWDRLKSYDEELMVADIANTAIENTDKDVDDTSAALLGAQLADRKYLFVYNNGSRLIYVGKSGVTAANGLPLPPGSLLELRFGAALSLHAIGGAGVTALNPVDTRLMEAS